MHVLLYSVSISKTGRKKKSLFFERIKTSQLIFQQAKDWRSFFSLPMISIVAIRWMPYTADDISVVSAASVCLSLHLDFGRPVIMISLISYYLAKLPDQIGTEKVANLRRQIKKFAKERETKLVHKNICQNIFSDVRNIDFKPC